MANIVSIIKDFVWGPYLTGLVCGIGCFILFSTRFFFLRSLKKIFKYIFLNANKSSSVEALLTSLGGALGVGNIIGVASALLMGGPGALFWMIISGVLGMGTCMLECAICSKYKVKGKDGYFGGPMYVFKYGLGNKTGLFLGSIYAFLLLVVSFGMGNMIQSNVICEAICVNIKLPKFIIALSLMLVILFISINSARVIFKINKVLVPLMSLFFIISCLVVIFINCNNLPLCLREIFRGAFSKKAVCSAFFGNIIVYRKNAFRNGCIRGVMSNEAGLGSAGVCSAHSDEADYIKNACVGMCSVFIDTIVICLITGLAFLSSGIYLLANKAGGLYSEYELCQKIFEFNLGEMGHFVMCLCTILFAFATIVTWAYQGVEAYYYFTKGRWKKLFACCFCLASFIGAIYPFGLLWDIADICNGLLIIPNAICIFIFGREIINEIKDYDFIDEKRDFDYNK